MKFSYQWLSDLTPGLSAVPAELERLITMKTAECEGVEAVEGDWIIEIDNKSLTHRPDLWGHYGMAREVAAITGGRLRDPVDLALLPEGAPAVRAEIADHVLCPRYSALVFESVRVGLSPAWLQTRLEHIGLNPINNIVDVTNFVLAELPQPMHAFDADKLTGNTIFVRTAHAGERLAALNGETYTLSTSDLVIADGAGAIALAGVIGGAQSAISESTKRIVLESANFQAASVRLTSARHKLRTDASMRFEKSLDPENTVRGIARAIELFRQVCAGIRTVGAVTDNRAVFPAASGIVLPVDFASRKLGKEVSQEEIVRILAALGFGVEQSSGGPLKVTVPTWRATKDISAKADLVEEIGRMIGYAEITPKPPFVASIVPPANPMRAYLRRVRAQLAAQGFTEVHNYSFLNEAELRRFGFDVAEHLGVRNPIAAELTHLRRSLLPGIFKNIAGNLRNFSEFRLFEIGNEIHPGHDGELPDERTHAVTAIYGAHADEQDFFELKRVVECVFPSARLSATTALAYEHPTRTAAILWHGAAIGRLFALHPRLLQQEGIEGRAVLLDVDLKIAQELAASHGVTYQPLRKYPTSGFDLSAVAGLRTPVSDIQDEVTRLAGSDLASVEFVRQYVGPPLSSGQKSVSYHLEVGALDRTLTAEEVASIRNGIVQGMREAGFEIRGVE